MAKSVYIADVCKEIFAGGDVPKSALSYEKTAEYNVPIFSNGEKNCGLYGYTNNARVKEPSITVSARGTIGYTAIRTEPFVPVVRLITLTPKSEVIDLDYLFYATQNYKFEGSGTSIPQLTVPMLKKYKFPLPEMSHQKAIAVKFEKLDQLISLRKQQLAKLDELVKARFVEMFGNPIENTMNWPKKLLRDITTKIGSGATPKGGRESYPNAGVSLIRSMNVYDGQFLYKDLAHLTDEQATQLNGVTVEAEDVLVNITGASVARSCVVPKDVLPARVNQHVAIVRCNRKLLNPIFTNKMFINNEFKKALLSIGESGGATRQAITKKQLEELSVVVPPLSIQNEFFTFSERVDQQKQTVQQSLGKLELMKKALMQEYFG